MLQDIINHDANKDASPSSPKSEYAFIIQMYYLMRSLTITVGITALAYTGFPHKAQLANANHIQKPIIIFSYT